MNLQQEIDVMKKELREKEKAIEYFDELLKELDR